MSRGKFIVLCGIDGSGKSSVIKSLTQEGAVFENFSVMKHPPKAWFDNPKICAAYLDGEGEKIEDEDEIAYVHELRRQEEKEIMLPSCKILKILYSTAIFFHYTLIILA